VTGGSGDRLLFSGLATDFTTALGQTDVSFNGVTGYFVDQFSGFYEVTGVPVPEPGTWLVGTLTLGALVFSQLGKRSRVAAPALQNAEN
jgi:PEP-CTERM motif-containing protein